MSDIERWHHEKQAAWIYGTLTQIERDATRSQMLRGLAQAAETQAEIIRGDVRAGGLDTPPFRPELRARVVVALARRFGIARTKTMLAALKVRGLSAYGSGSARGPVAHPMPVSTTEIGARHKSHGASGVLRAAVFGVNDGLVSNTSLILGMTGAASSSATVLVTGIAGMLAGAFSMAAGEYISMRSQRELHEFQIAEERDELERYPEEEAEELALIYAGRGMPIEAAREMSTRMLEDKEQMLDTLAREELGLNPDDLGSPIGAALSSFTAFALGALVPLFPYFFSGVVHPVQVACISAAAALFAVGAVLSLFSGRNAFYGGMRMLGIGALAGLATFAIGRWIGVSLT
ncbi:MAG: VIT1/CCC1 transporter family protein [Planctomycetes bacterium]|nr:VIT1/CCC1 transporter family protein [Planctomycetota bacterium]